MNNMTLTIEFVKDNLPTSEQQLALFKEILNFYNVENINWISSLEEVSYTERYKIKRLGMSFRINPYEAYNCGEKYYLLNTVNTMLEDLAHGIQIEKVVTILEPQVIIYPVQQDNGIDLRGVIGVI